MISEPDRSKAIELIDEAHASGARLSKACEELGITERTYYRWINLQKEHGSYEDRRPYAERPEPINKLSPEERQQVLDTVNDPKYASMPPCEIVPALADEGIYIASESTFYRILREEKMQNHRGRAEEPQHRPISSHEATAPNQVWMWDITFIKMIHGHMYLTAIIDWYSRKIVGWNLSDTLDTVHVINAVMKAVEKYGVPGIINSDQGSQFTSTEYKDLLKSLNIRQSMDGRSRWADNVIIERWFRSLKTEKIYINEFRTPNELRAGIRDYINEYNSERPHEAHDYATPDEIYYGSFRDNGKAAA